MVPCCVVLLCRFFLCNHFEIYMLEGYLARIRSFASLWSWRANLNNCNWTWVVFPFCDVSSLEQIHWHRYTKFCMKTSENVLILAHKNGFGPGFFHKMLRLAKGTTKPNTCCWMVWLVPCSIPVSHINRIENPILGLIRFFFRGWFLIIGIKSNNFCRPK
jgi:hypothetical protein